MDPVLVALALAALTVHWWGALLRVLLADLRQATAESLPEPRASARRSTQPAPLAFEARVPLGRVLAFRGVQRRVAARRRWEGGFGRRGL